MAARKWTAEQRKQQSLKIKQWQPWTKSTGARTAEGKAVSAKNAYKGLQPLVAEDVADVIFFAASRPAHVNINDIVLTPVAQGSATLAIRK